jgi:hypothetical protein
MTTRLTVGEIAKRIQEPDEDLTAVVDRLRNWTDEGLLKPLDYIPGTGRGRKRFYSERTLIDALVLNALTELGIPAVRITRICGKLSGTEKTFPLLRLARMAFEQTEERERNGEWCWLSINRDPSRKELGPTAILHVTKDIHDPSESKRVDDLTRSFEDVRIPHWSQASIVLNLTKLFQRLQNPGEK